MGRGSGGVPPSLDQGVSSTEESVPLVSQDVEDAARQNENGDNIIGITDESNGGNNNYYPNKENEFVSSRYSTTLDVRSFHATPRFSFTKDISVLASPHASERLDYWIGASLFSIVIFSIFGLWSIILLTWKVMGGKRVGFLSGSPFKPRSSSSSTVKQRGEDNELLASSKKKKKKKNKPSKDLSEYNDNEDGTETGKTNNRCNLCCRCIKGCGRALCLCCPSSHRTPVDPKRVRLIFVISSLLLLVFLLTSVLMGLESIPKAYRALEEVHAQTNDYLVKAANVTSHLFTAGNSALFIRDEVLFHLDKICETNLTTLPTLLGMQHSDYMKPLNNLEKFMDEYMGGITDGIITIRDFFDDVDEKAQLAAQLRFTYVVLVAVLGLGTILLMVGTILAHYRKLPTNYQAFLHVAISPIFVLSLFFTCIVWCSILLATIMNADFCSASYENFPQWPPGPDSTVLAMLARQPDIEVTSMEYQIVVTVVDGCSDASAPILDLTDEQQQLSDGIQATGTILDLLGGDNLAQYEKVCQAPLSPVRKGVSTLVNDLRSFSEGLGDMEQIITCSHLSPIYTKLSHQVMCDMSIHGLVWFYSSLVIVTIFGFIMIMLRSSFIQEDRNNTIVLMDAATSLKSLEEELELAEEGEYEDDDGAVVPRGGSITSSKRSTSTRGSKAKKSSSSNNTPALSHLKEQGDMPDWLE